MCVDAQKNRKTLSHRELRVENRKGTGRKHQYLDRAAAGTTMRMEEEGGNSSSSGSAERREEPSPDDVGRKEEKSSAAEGTKRKAEDSEEDGEARRRQTVRFFKNLERVGDRRSLRLTSKKLIQEEAVEDEKQLDPALVEKRK